MSKLHFTLNFGSSELSSLDLPIEVRKPNLALVVRTLSSQPVELGPGTYYITAKLPAGQELSLGVKVKEGKDISVMLTPEPEDMSPHEWQAVQHFLGGQVSSSSQADQFELLGPHRRAEVRLRTFRRYPGIENYIATDTLSMLSATQHGQGVAQFYIMGSNGIQLVQLLQPRGPAINMALPAWVESRCLLALTRLSNDLCSFDVHLEHMVADTLLRYFQKGFLEQAATMTNSNALQAEQLLDRKKGDPIAAAVGAYALLRLGDLERLHDWTENLKNWFTWLPDGIAIRGEHLARLGDHKQALSVFLELPSRGIPIFSDGLSYTIDRLRLYIRASASDFEIVKLSHAQTLLEQLQRFATFVDFRNPILTFTGIDPNKPSDEPISENIASYGGLDIAPYLG